MAKVTVVIPTYNRADLIGRAIRSVLNQTETDWECVIVDDGSEDNTKDVVNSFSDPRIHYIFQSNQKSSIARNTGLKASTSELVTFLDSDDYFLPHKLDEQIKFLQSHPDQDLIASGWVDVDPRGNLIQQHTPWNIYPNLDLSLFLFQCPVFMSAVMVRKECLEKVDGFDPSLHYSEDWDLWLRLSYTGYRLAWHPEIVGCRTIHSKSLIRNIKAMNQGMVSMFRKLYNQPNLPIDILNRKNKIFGNICINSVARALGAGQGELALEYAREALIADTSLLTGDPPTILLSLASAALTPIVPDKRLYVLTWWDVFNHLQPELHRSLRELQGLLCAVESFNYFNNKNRPQARLSAVKALLFDPSWLKNRGLVSILFKPR